MAQSIDARLLLFLRLVVPVVIFILLIFNTLWFSKSSVTQIRSIRAFFDITANSEWTTFLLLMLWVYILFVPNMFAGLLGQYFGHYDYITVNDTCNRIVLEIFKNDQNPTKGGTFYLLVIPNKVYTSIDFINKVNEFLKPYNVFMGYDAGERKFFFRSGEVFRLSTGSTLMKLVGNDPDKMYLAGEINPFTNVYHIEKLTCVVYEILCDQERFINNPYPGSSSTVQFSSIFNPSHNLKYRTIFYFAFSVAIILWKAFNVNAYRNIGKTLGENILDAQINALNATRVRYNMIAIAISMPMLAYIIFNTVTNQDLTPLQDIHL